MLPDPLHPAVVHFPIVLTFLLPLVAIIALRRARAGSPSRTAWLPAVAVAAALFASAWLAVQTGERDEEAVEEVTGEAPIHAHEEAAERFLLYSGALALLAAGGLAGGRVGSTARIGATIAAVALVAAGWQVGHSGGALVYEHNAASAHAARAPVGLTDHGDD